MSFTYTASAADWGRIAPELVLAVVALLILMVDLLLPQPGKNQKGSANFLLLPLLSLFGLGGAIVATIMLFIFGDHLPAFNSMIKSIMVATIAPPNPKRLSKGNNK